MPSETRDPQDDTGRLEGLALDVARERRPTEQRVGHLEKRADKTDDKIDTIDEKVDRLELTVTAGFATVTAKLETLPGVITLLREELAANRQDKHTVLKQTLDISGYDAKARADSTIIATTGKWKTISAFVGGLVGAGGVLTAIIALLASGKC